MLTDADVCYAIGGYKGVIKPGHERNARNLWKGAISKVRIMNLLESKVNRVLRMCQVTYADVC
jgi:hypothetical protein